MKRRKKEREKTNRHAPRVRERKKGAAARPRVCQREGFHVSAERREEKWSAASGKREKKKER
jgi:hypothetical protein